jgi:hypothetical protein
MNFQFHLLLHFSRLPLFTFQRMMFRWVRYASINMNGGIEGPMFLLQNSLAVIAWSAGGQTRNGLFSSDRVCKSAEYYMAVLTLKSEALECKSHREMEQRLPPPVLLLMLANTVCCRTGRCCGERDPKISVYVKPTLPGILSLGFPPPPPSMLMICSPITWDANHISCFVGPLVCVICQNKKFSYDYDYYNHNNTNESFWEELIAPFALIWHVPSRKRPV